MACNTLPGPRRNGETLMAISPKTVLALVQVRRSLKGSLKLAAQAVENIESTLAELKPTCRACLFERGLTDKCECAGQSVVDNSRKTT